MERTIEISTGVRDHLDLADLKAGAFGIVLLRSFAREEIADHRRRQALVRDHSFDHRVTQIEEIPGVRQDSKSVSEGTSTPRIFDLFMLNFDLC